MNRNQSKTFLTELIKSFPNSRGNITNKEALVDTWQFAFERVEYKNMMAALDIFKLKGKYFPSPDEFSRYLLLVDQEQSRTTRTFNFETSGCTVCPYLEEGQTEPCVHCMFEGGKRRYDKGN